MANKSIDCPPNFDGLNFPIWKVKMSLFLRSQGSRVAKAFTKEFVEPTFGDVSLGPIAPSKDMKPMQRHHML